MLGPERVVRLPAEAAAHLPGLRVAWPHLSGPQRSRDTFSQVRAGALGQGKLDVLQAGLAQPATVRNSAVIQKGVFKDLMTWGIVHDGPGRELSKQAGYKNTAWSQLQGLGVHPCVSSCTEKTLRSKHPHLNRGHLWVLSLRMNFSLSTFPYFPNFLQ